MNTKSKGCSCQQILHHLVQFKHLGIWDFLLLAVIVAVVAGGGDLGWREGVVEGDVDLEIGSNIVRKQLVMF